MHDKDRKADKSSCFIVAYYNATIFYSSFAESALMATGVFQLEKGSAKLSCVDFYFAAEDNGALTYYHNQTGSQDVAASVVVEGGAEAVGTINEELTSKNQTPETILLSAFGK